jgi:hypothetical protein
MLKTTAEILEEEVPKAHGVTQLIAQSDGNTVISLVVVSLF